MRARETVRTGSGGLPGLAYSVAGRDRAAAPGADPRIGAAAPIVFLHGAGGAGPSWHRQLDAFSPERRCITIDLPGHGASRAIRWTSLDDAADAVAHVLSALGDRPAHLVGFSLGGGVAIRLLARHPELIASALVTGANTVPVPALERGLDVLTWPAVSNPVAHRLFIRSMGLDPAERARYAASSGPMRMGDYGRLNRELLRGTETAGLSELTVPVLALAGAREARHERRSARDIAARVPQGLWAEVPGVGHTWHVRHAERFNTILADWLERPAELPRPLRSV